ncbi:hypothetical protein OTSANNIE_0872 [Anaplasma phagocytophilum str. Annie]|nr:hypothetical protein APHNYW_1375 [Anaplasma phagocytophilum str. ApNYW]KJV98707.1 hypothetical protein OTSANNIE_0872 [Anaplasma phagocytophilum str. Annie]
MQLLRLITMLISLIRVTMRYIAVVSFMALPMIIEAAIMANVEK